MQLKRKAYMICQGKNILAVVPNRRISKNPKYSGMEIKSVKNVMYGLRDLSSAIDANVEKVCLSPTASDYEGMCSRLSVEYRLESVSETTALPIWSHLELIDSSTGEILYVLESRIKCKIKICEYTVYTLTPIPITEINDTSDFIGKLKDAEYRRKYQVVCIAEKMNPEFVVSEFGFVFIDFMLLKQILISL